MCCRFTARVQRLGNLFPGVYLMEKWSEHLYIINHTDSSYSIDGFLSPFAIHIGRNYSIETAQNLVLVVGEHEGYPKISGVKQEGKNEVYKFKYKYKFKYRCININCVSKWSYGGSYPLTLALEDKNPPCMSEWSLEPITRRGIH